MADANPDGPAPVQQPDHAAPNSGDVQVGSGKEPAADRVLALRNIVNLFSNLPLEGPQMPLTTDDDLTSRTADLLGLADVKRWTVIRTIRDQSVAEHCFNTAVIAMELTERLIKAGLDLSNFELVTVTSWALLHDAPETLTGDIDGKFKREYPGLRAELTECERDAFPWYGELAHKITVMFPRVNVIVKIADRIEAIQFIRHWGLGQRADAARHELEKVLAAYCESNLFIIRVDRPVLLDIVSKILRHSCMEANNIQDRLLDRERDRRQKAAAAEPANTGHGPQVDPAAT